MRSPTRSEKIFVAALAITAGIVSFFALGPLAVDGWLVLRLRSSDQKTWRDAAEALIRRGSGFGVRAAVTKVLETEPELPIRIPEWLSLLADGKDFRARLALPAFRDGLKSVRKEARRTALNILRRSPWSGFPETVPIFEEALASGDPVLRWQAAYVLGEIGEPARAIAPALIRALEDGDPNMRWATVWALGQMASSAKDVIPALGRLLADSSDLVSCEAARSLAAFGPLAASETSRLAAAVVGPDPLRAEAAAALAEIGKGARAAAPALLAALEKEGKWEGDDRSLVLSPDLGEQIPQDRLMSGDGDPAPDGRAQGIRAILRMGGIGQAQLPLLLTFLDGKDHSLRQEALRAIGSLGPAAGPAAPKIVDVLIKSAPLRQVWFHEVMNEAAAATLVRIGPPAEPPLLDSIRRGPLSRCSAVIVLAAMENPSDAASMALRAMRCRRARWCLSFV